MLDWISYFSFLYARDLHYYESSSTTSSVLTSAQKEHTKVYATMYCITSTRMRSFPHVRSPWRIRHNGHAVEPRVQLQPYIRWTRDNRQGGQGHEDTGTDQLSITSFPEGYIRGGSVATCWFELEQSFRPDPSKEDDHTVCLSGVDHTQLLCLLDYYCARPHAS
ncbi:hypothetical protein M752DRAFT_119673 [Aspergillus phoenicis ATCC 13157]|uniref:Uncharacterized protein n=1 Tax=Aspergillus phoenicis ATCC 13157 TaxID=1353007 RepID=A0A370PTF6_ASPPH|nr:hypothetical protein M752DRAFT_119673 [Aspergillus phoenicis ATCC 13157]